jgi:hypothetical protein
LVADAPAMRLLLKAITGCTRRGEGVQPNETDCEPDIDGGVSSHRTHPARFAGSTPPTPAEHHRSGSYALRRQPG